MAQHIGPVFLGHVRGQVDPGPEQPQQEGGGDAVAQILPVSQGDAGLHPPPDAPIAKRRIQHQRHSAYRPENGSHSQRHLHGVGAWGRDRGSILRQRRIDRRIDWGDLAWDDGSGGQGDVTGDDLALGNQTQRAHRSIRQHQPQPHQRPQPEQQILGSLAQNQPQQQNGENQIAGT